MARGESRGKLCSYKRTTVVICSINIVAALYILHSLYTSLYIYSDNADSNAGKFTEDQIKRMEDSIRIRKASEPIELVRMVKKIKEDFSRGNSVPELSRPVKQMVTKEILQKLKGLHANANVSEQREALESWRQEKLREVKQLTLGQTTLNSTIPAKEAKKLLKALEFDWTVLLEEIGVWMPAEIVHKEHYDKPERELELEDQIIPGRPIPPECHAEIHTDYDGTAVRWGLTHPKESAADCCQACLDQAKYAKLGELKCNIWVYCPSETGCYSPDIYEHKHQECWLKHAEKPRLNFKDKYLESYRDSHSTAPVIVPWISGITSS
ncbi:uncharacterized protein LOC122661282 isoform X1 [Telopea speciosissima]|uniref:uncharacterized protein LOC122661282 isoform X1 n=1 Tax=Telopea speciosissima TaxID=54955 RepID=UPI001CC6A255|nr:uncharacterized protein LOC122661282 isoform X1 [Telopea speciosissima]